MGEGGGNETTKKAKKPPIFPGSQDKEIKLEGGKRGKEDE